ncbi:MAG TPA: ATPase domain-containing protein, partial [Ktedonobacterales bacterium]|nr:ATPase domain-containing protein [Ktedonobacterales bacterium]
TSLASQIAFSAARTGKKVVVLTALSESTNKLIDHLRGFTFFDSTLVGGSIQFLSLQQVLGAGLSATRKLVLEEARRLRADLILLDGFRGMRSVDVEPQAAREFLYELGTTLNTLRTTLIITSETDPRDPAFFPETTTADIILGLHYTLQGVRQHREIEVIKARGRAPLPGLHTLTISTDGASVYPQLEERIAHDVLGGDAQTLGAASLSAASAQPLPHVDRTRFDLPELDEMLTGGIPRATCTLLAGSLGTGKTFLAMAYAMAAVRAGEPTVFLGFRESREQLVLAASAFAFGAEFARAVEPGGGIMLLDVPPIKLNPDVLGDRLLNELDRSGARRLIIDSIAELERALLRSGDTGRLEDYLAALLLALRSRHVTALMLKETDKAVAPTLDFSADILSVLAENVLLLQQVPYQGQLHRILSILKLRFSDHDPSLREFEIKTPEGIRMLGRAESALGVLDGITQLQEQRATGGRGSPSARATRKAHPQP